MSSKPKQKSHQNETTHTDSGRRETPIVGPDGGNCRNGGVCYLKRARKQSTLEKALVSHVCVRITSWKRLKEVWEFQKVATKYGVKPIQIIV